MSKLLQQREQMVYPPEVATNDQVSWSYIHSFNSSPFSAQDLDASNYKYAQQASSGRDMFGEGRFGSSAQGDSSSSGGKFNKSGVTGGSRKEAIDRFATIIDAEAPRFSKQRRENYKAWEQSVQGLTSALHKGMDAYYERRTEVHNDIVHSAISRRNELWPQADINEITEEIRDMTLAPWIFQSLPGTKPATQWPNSLPQLAERLDQLEPCSLWNEPLDIICGGPEFFQQAREYILTNVSSLASGAVKDATQAVDDTALALSCHFAISIQTGNHQLIMEALDLHLDISQKLNEDLSTKIFEKMKTRAVKSLKDMTEILQRRQEQKLHYLQSSSVHGVISLAKYVSFVNLSEFYSSITIDSAEGGGHLYLWISMPQRGSMFKIGTGEAGTVAGKVYGHAIVNDREGEVTWVYCQGKLWGRRVNDGADLGQLLVFDPVSFKCEGTAKIVLNVPQSQNSIAAQGEEAVKQANLVNAINKYYPLLTDGTNLFAITMNLTTKRRRVKDSMRKHYQLFQEEKKRQRNEPKPLQLSKPSSSSKAQEEALKKEAKALAALAREEARKKKREEKEKGASKGGDQDDRAINEKMMRDLTRQKIKEQKAAILSRGQELKKELASAPPGEESVPSKDQQQKEEANIEQYHVCEFYLHEFDIAASCAGASSVKDTSATPPVKDLVADSRIIEIFTAFSGFFSYEECYRALKSCNDDVCEAVTWLVDEGEKERGKKALVKNKSLLIAESEIAPQPAQLQVQPGEGQPPSGGLGGRRGPEIETIVKEGSILTPQNITAGKWTISARNSSGKQYLTYHNLSMDNGQAKVFSTNPHDLKVSNEQKVKRESSLDIASENNEEVKVEDKAQGTQEQTSESSPSIPSELPSPQMPKSEEPIDISSLKEDDLYENIKLYGTLVKVIKYPKTSTFADLTGHNTYVIYDHCHKKYYIMLLASSYRYIAVASDLTEMYEVLKEHSSLSKKEKSQEADQDMKNLSDFSLALVQSLSEIGKARFNMPWKWSPWSNNFQQVINQWNIEQDFLPHDSSILNGAINIRSTIEQRKKQQSKLQTKLDKILAYEKQFERNHQIGIPFNEKSVKKQEPIPDAKKDQKKHQKEKAPESIQAIIEEAKKKTATKVFKKQRNDDQSEKKRVFEESEEWGGSSVFASPPGVYNNFSNPYTTNLNQYMSRGERERKEKESQPQSEMILPKERIIVYKQSNKIYTYCVIGNYETLSILVRLMTHSYDTGNKELYSSLLRQALDWVIYAETLVLSNKEAKNLIDSLYNHLTTAIVKEHQKGKEACARSLLDSLWRILILGCELFVRTTQRQFELFNLILSQSTSDVYTQPSTVIVPPQLLGDLTKANIYEDNSSKKPITKREFLEQHYMVRLLQTSMNPLQLFYYRYFYYHASIYQMEVLLQSRVTTHVVLIDKIHFPNAPTYSHYDQQRIDIEEAEEDQNNSTLLIAKYGAYRNETDCFQYYRRAPEISISQCKEYQLKNIETGSQINRSFFGVPLYLMMIKHFEIIENLDNYKKETLNLEYAKSIYNENPYKATEGLIQPKEIHLDKLRQLYSLRKEHANSSSELLKNIQKIIKHSLNEPSPDCAVWDDSLHRFLMIVFAELVRPAILQVDWNVLSQCDSVVEHIKFIDEMLKVLIKKTNSFQNSPLKAHQIAWFNQIKELLSVFIHTSYTCVGNDNFTYFANKSLPHMLSIIENLKLIFTFTKEEQPSSSSSKNEKEVEEPSDIKAPRKVTVESLLDHVVGYMQEGTDFSIEKVFETPHPYPKGEYAQKDTIQINKAIAYSIEIDKRSSTEFNSDCLLIQSADHAFWVNDTFGTHIRLYGKSNSKLPFMILGNKFNIEFRSYPHSSKKGGGHNYRGRGGFGGGGGRGEPPSGPEDAALRWGFKLIIRPIYGEPQYGFKSNLRKEHYQEVMKKIGVEPTVNIISLLNQLIFMTSKFTRAVMEANVTIGEESLAQAGSVFRKHVIANEQENFQKFMNWHLFKGGVQTKTIDQLHNPSILDEIFRFNQATLESKQLESTKKLEEYKEKKINKAEDQLRKRHGSISHIARTAEQIDPSTLEFQPKQELWSNEIKEIMQNIDEDDGFTSKVLGNIRKLVPYKITYQNEKMRPAFNKTYQLEWTRVEKILILVMLYHSSSIDEAKLFLTQQQDASKNERIDEKFKLIGTQLNDVLSWMQSRLQGEQEFQFMLNDITEESQKYIQTIVEQKRAEEAEREKLRLKAEEEQKAKDEEKKRKEEAEKLKQDKEAETAAKLQAAELARKAPIVSKDKVVNKNKRKNIVKHSSSIKEADLLKMKEKSKQKKAAASKIPELAPSQQIQPVEEEKKEEELSEPEKPVPKVDESKQVKLLEVTPNEERDIKQKIYFKVYESFLQLYQGNQDRVKPLCQLFNIQFNPEDPNESLRAIFKRVKAKLKPIMDFDGDLPIREKVDIHELQLQSPYQEIGKEVKARLLFLLEIKPSIDYHSKVIQVDINQINKRAYYSNAAIQKSQDGDNLSLQQQQYAEASNNGDDDSEVLEPLEIQRSQSVQVALQPSLSGISGVTQAVINEQSKMKEDEIVNWIDNYRKWRQWNRQHKLLVKGAHIGQEFFEDDLTSPYCSPLYSVVAFAKSSKVMNPESLRKIFISHQMKAGFRMAGLQQQDQLLRLLWQTPYQRLIIGNLSQTLQESTFFRIETCGETLAQGINETARMLLRSMMSFVIQSRNNIEKLTKKRLLAHDKQAQLQQAAASAPTQKLPTQQKQNSSSSSSASSQQKQSSHQKHAQMKEDMTDHQLLKLLLQSLNDIRVVLNDYYTREYVLESLRHYQKNLGLQFSKSGHDREEKYSIAFDSIRDFLSSIVELMLQFNQGSSQFLNKTTQMVTSKIQFAISYCCKLILNQFMTDKSMMRSNETHKLLQEILLDIVVEKLEKLCGLKKSKRQSKEDKGEADEETKEASKQEKKTSKQSVNRLNSINSQDEIVQLMKLLSEVIRISNDHQQHLQSMQQLSASGKDLKTQEYFLSEGSDKVMRCASILAFMMHKVEVPIVMRQTIKCARLFFKLVDFKKLKLHKNEQSQVTPSMFEKDCGVSNEFLLETLRKIGSKISNTQDSSKPKEDEQSTEEKQYFVYANINSSEEDFSFLITALYHWESMYPTFTLELSKDPNEIVVKTTKEDQKEEENKNENASGAKAEPGASSKEPASSSQAAADSHAARLLQQISDIDSNVDLQELINLQKQQILQNQPMRGGRGRGARGPPGPRPGERPSTSAVQYPDSRVGFRGQVVQGAYVPGNVKPSGPQPSSYSSYQQSLPMIAQQQLGIIKLDVILDEMIKATWEDAKDTDSEEEKLRKLNERNYNLRIQTHVKDAVQLACLLYQRYSAPVTEPMPYTKALEFSNILHKAYKGQIEPIGINPYLKAESKEKKLSDQKTVAQHFPLVYKSIDTGKKKDVPPGAGVPIVIAPKRLVVSLAELSLAQKYEQNVETKTSALKQLEKNPIEGFKCNVIPQSIRRQGASISVIIQEFILLLRSLISTGPNSYKTPQTLMPALSSESEISFTKQKSILKMQQQQETISSEMIQIVNHAIEKLATENWSDFKTVDKEIIFGLFSVIGGWTPPMKTGQVVQVEINNQWVEAILVDDGLGKKRVSVILEDDDTLSIQKISIYKVRPLQRFEWQFDSPSSQSINQQRLCQAVINIYNQVKCKAGTMTPENVSEQTGIVSNHCSMLSDRFLLLMLLKVTSKQKWYFMDKSNETFVKFMEILRNITKEDIESEEDKTRSYWEKSLIDSWERLIDRDEDRNLDFFVVKENLLKEKVNKEMIQDEQKDKVKEEEKEAKKESPQKFRKELQLYQDNEFVQPLSSYLIGLPEPIPKKNSSEAALKLLAYWEKYIIPKIVEFVRTTYKPWEMEFYFEQLRHHLRNGDSIKALEDAMTMCERKMPQGCTVPDENYDWTCKMIDECIVDTWALAKIKHHRSQTQNNLNSAQASSSQQQGLNSQQSSQGETSFPLFNKLFNYGIEEIVVLIKAVDLRANVVLAEYQDPDTMQIHSIWIPASHLSDLHNPLPPRAVGYTVKTLKNQFEYSVRKTLSIFARQTIIQFFKAFQEERNNALTSSLEEKVFNLPTQQMQIQEIISWSVWEEFSTDPITGWMNDLNCAIPISKESKSPSLTETPNDSTTQIDTSSQSTSYESGSTQFLQALVQESSENLVNDQMKLKSAANAQPSQADSSVTTLNVIKDLFEQTIKGIDETKNLKSLESEDVKIVQSIVEWTIMNWYNISARISSDRAVFDLCHEYDKMINSASQPSDDSSLASSIQLLPLHELVGKYGGQSSGAIGTLIMFKKNGAHLTPTSKMQFYSDANKVNLITEISAGTEGKKDLPPLMLNHGSIWVNFDMGTTALLPKHLQTDQKSSLPCAVVQIPNTWTVCCWLTDTITNALLTNVDNSSKFTIDIFEKLIGALTAFYAEANAPSMLKSIVFKLLSRLIIKLRFIYRKQKFDSDSEKKDQLKQHFKRLFISQDFISSLLTELHIHKEQEEVALQYMPQGSQVSILYTAFVQDCVELILTMMMPTIKDASLNSFNDLFLQDSSSLPNWLHPLVKALYFMQYFRGEMPLSRDILLEIHAETKLQVSQLDQIIVLQGIPIKPNEVGDLPAFSKDVVYKEIVKLAIKHGARILNPAKDITFSEAGDSVAIIFDGFDHMALASKDDKADPNAPPSSAKPEIESESDSENDEDGGDGKLVPKKEEVKAEEEMPVIYNCPVCTFENSIDVAGCDMCGTARPPIEQIIADFRAANKPPEEKAKTEASKEGEVCSVPKKTLIQEKMEELAKDMSKLISKLERKIVQERKQKAEEEKKQKEAEEAKLKAQQEEEQKKKQAEEAAAKVSVEQSQPQKQSEKPKGPKPLKDAKPMVLAEPKLVKAEAVKPQAQAAPRKLSHSSLAHSEGSMSDAESGLAGYYKEDQMPGIDQLDNDLQEMVESQPRPEGRRAGDKRSGRRNRGGDDEMRQKLIDGGIDPALLDQDPDLAQVLLESLLQSQEEERKVKEEEEQRIAKAKEEEEKRIAKEKARIEAEQAAKSGIVLPPKIKYTKLKALVGENQVFDNTDSARFVYNILRDRLYENDQFNITTLALLKEIHESYAKAQNLEDMNPIPSDLTLLQDFELTQASIKESSYDEFVGQCDNIAAADIREFIKLIESQGYDIWMNRAFHASYIIPEDSNKMISIQLLEKLKQFIEVEMCKESKGVVALQPSALRLLSKIGIVPDDLSDDKKPINYYNDSLIGANYPELHDPRLSQADLRYQWALLRVFNKYLAPTVPFINTSQSMADLIPQSSIPLKLSSYMASTRNLCLLNVKFDLRHLILEKTSIQREHAPKLYFERLKLAHKNREQGSPVDDADGDNGGASSPKGAAPRGEMVASGQSESSRKDKQRQQDFMFVQAYEQIKDMDLAQLRPKKPQGAEPHLSFHIVFRGEHVVGEGGPYRQFFADISSELQPMSNTQQNTSSANSSSQATARQLNLLCPTPNNRSGSNIGRGKFTLSPSRTSSHDLSLFEFLGLMMGVCIRTGAHMNIDLPQFVWKQLTGQKVNHEDLIEIDLGFWKLMSFMVTAQKKLYDDSIFETWSVLLSDETVVELREQGKEQRVLYEERVEYVKQALLVRLKESSLQCQAIKRGIAKIIPEALLNMVTYSELETWVCGKAIVDIDLLKRHTKYGGDKKTTLLTEDSRRIKWFWEVLREFSEEDKQKFIKFCWGQQRLPANDEEFERRQTRFMIKPAMKSNHGDGALPKADTCFFNLELPDYSSKEIMRQRILLAIHTDCDSMNAEADRMDLNADSGGHRNNDHDQSYDDEY